MLSYVADGRYVHVSGGLLCPDEDKNELLRQTVLWALKERRHLSFYNITPRNLPLFREAGFQITKWGDDFRLPLNQWTDRGKPFEWLRRQTNYALRQGLTFAECRREDFSSTDWNHLMAELQQITDIALMHRPQVREIGFLNGTFDPRCLGRRRLFVARTKAGRIDGYLLCNPCRAGREWALEQYRQRSDAVRGTIPFLMHQAVLRFQAEGVDEISLCCVPALGTSDIQPGESRRVRYGLAASRYASFIFDATGLQHFKTRFRPETEPRYLCVSPAATWGSLASFIRVCGALNLSFLKLARDLWRRTRRAA